VSELRPLTGRRHPITVVRRAQRLHEGGWTAHAIRRILEQQGVQPPPSVSTIRRWLDDGCLERHRARVRNWNRQQAEDARWRRLVALRALGLSVSDTAKVMTLDFGDPVTEHAVMRSEQAGRWMRPWARAGQEAA